RELRRACQVAEHAQTLQAALEDWARVAPELESVYAALNCGEIDGFDLDFAALASPLPRAYQWLDGSAYLTHVERVRKARGAEMPPSFLSDPLMYQGGSDDFLGPRDPICVADEQWGIDFEAEVAVLTDDVSMGINPAEASGHIKLLMLVNDVSLRSLIPSELTKGFGFLHGKPASAFSPVAVTPDELGEAWDGAKVHLPLVTSLNDKMFGNPDAGKDMQFDFPSLVSHAARTRRLGAGTIVGSGTISNVDRARGCSCIAEQRVLEIIDTGKAVTPFMHYGDRVRIEMLDESGKTIFGAIEQEVQPCGGQENSTQRREGAK
ncbi:MAG: fumarylacetoacetate hydrolase family protein, partial [Acidiferrobacterales bacterium]